MYFQFFFLCRLKNCKITTDKTIKKNHFYNLIITMIKHLFPSPTCYRTHPINIRITTMFKGRLIFSIYLFKFYKRYNSTKLLSRCIKFDRIVYILNNINYVIISK